MDPYLAWGLALLGAGLVLAVIEMFVPSGGLIGIGAALAAVAGVVCLFFADAAWGWTGTLVVLVLTPMLVVFAVKIWPSTPMGQRIIGAPTEEEVEAKRAAEEAERSQRMALVGQEGVVLTDLRPVGTVEVGGVRYDALSETLYIPAGMRVKVTAVEGAQVKVRQMA